MNIKLSMDKIQLFAYFITIVLAGFIALSCPFSYISAKPPLSIDVLFTSVSAVCVTGLSTLPMDLYSTAGLWVIMMLIEFGGLGIISFIALYVAGPRRKVSLVNRVVVQQFYIDDVETDPRKILRAIIVFTLLIELTAAAFMYKGFLDSGSKKPVLDALFHSVSAFCNAGFSTYNDSLVSFYRTPRITWTITILIVVGGIGFMVLTDIWKKLTRKKRGLSMHAKFTLGITISLIFFGAFMLFFFEKSEEFLSLSLSQRIMVSFFQSITPRTAGFSVMEQGVFSPVFQFVTLVLMFIGGSPGSIAGGIKTTTFAIVFLYALKGNSERVGLNVGNRNIGTPIIEKAFNIMAKSIMIIITSVFLLLIFESAKLYSGRFSIFDIVFETVSAFATVGLSQGITNELSFMGKIVIIATMFIGRTGIAAMAAGFLKNERERFFQYPSASIAVG